MLNLLKCIVKIIVISIISMFLLSVCVKATGVDMNLSNNQTNITNTNTDNNTTHSDNNTTRPTTYNPNATINTLNSLPESELGLYNILNIILIVLGILLLLLGIAIIIRLKK